MYVLGVDGGGTKTQCYIGTLDGDILGEGFGGPANYQICGKAVCENSIREAIHKAVQGANIQLDQVAYAVFGLSGADEPVDFEFLVPMCRRIMGEVPFEVLHDSWIGLRTCSDFGIVSICGTGAGHSGMNPKGEKHALRNLNYETGNLGGGSQVVSDALHYAFRSEEGTYDKSLLEGRIPEAFGLKTMEQVCNVIRQDWEVPEDAAFQIPIITFKTADEGDAVAREIIGKMGRELGRYASGVIRHLEMADEAVPCILVGSLFGTGSPWLINPYMEEVRKTAPKAFTMIPLEKPVMGAYLLAMDAVAQSGC